MTAKKTIRLLSTDFDGTLIELEEVKPEILPA